MNIDPIYQRILADPNIDTTDPRALAALVREEMPVISDVDVLHVLRKLREDTFGAGLIDHLLSGTDVTDVVVNGPEQVWVDRGRGLAKAELRFANDDEVRALAVRLATACGHRLDDALPFADGRMVRADGTTVRVHAVLSPPSTSGTCISLRILRQAEIDLDGLVANGTIPQPQAEVLKTMVAAHRSFLVVGGTGTGKTTLLAALLAESADTERIICIEDTAELHPRHPHVVNLVTRAKNTDGAGEVTMSQLLRQCLRMRPDRIVVGEIRGEEVVDLLAALNTGHDGGAGTIHANSPTEVPARLEALAALGGMDRDTVHAQMAAALDVIVSLARDSTGHRFLHQIAVFEGNPVRIKVVWDAHSGAQEGYEEWVSCLR